MPLYIVIMDSGFYWVCTLDVATGVYTKSTRHEYRVDAETLCGRMNAIYEGVRHGA